MAKYKVRNSEIKKALRAHKGNISEVARELKVSRGTIYNRMGKFPELQKIKEEEDERLLDEAEKKMFELAAAGNITALIFTLKTKGKHRGWSENQQIEIQAKVESKTGGVRTPADDARYLTEVLLELRKLGMREDDPPPPEVVEGKFIELGDGLGVPGVDPTEEAPERAPDLQVEDWDRA